MDSEGILDEVVLWLKSLVRVLEDLNPGLDPILWALVILGGFGLLAAFSRKLIGLLISAAIIVAGIFVAWQIAGGG